ncbi:hypothetical protein ACFV2U_36135 [Streptomyces sp. NPDC059697]|uniref:hypothetical protein n=1 Tax=Streptomyces sp. NPDC059697 TaxID=3346912 RepID=UPI00368C82C0
MGRLARAERTAAKQRAQQDAPAYLAAETTRLQDIREQMVTEAEQWWHALLSNDEATVCEAVNTAFSDNPAAGCAVGVDGHARAHPQQRQVPWASAPARSSASTAKNPTCRCRRRVQGAGAR